MKRFISLTSVLLLTTTACGKSSNTSDNAGEVPSADVGVAPGTVATPPETKPVTAEAEAPTVDTAPVAVTVAMEVDATNKTAFAHLDLDTGKIVPETDLSWDLAFKRTSIKLNLDVTAQVVLDSTFDAILKAPTAEYAADAPVAGGKETDGLVFHSGLGWYNYNMETHVISSNNYVYFVKSNAGSEFKVSVSDYYSADRLPAFIQLKLLEVAVETVSPPAAKAE